MADSRDITGKNRKFTGTAGIKLPSGTEAQRVGAEAGELRFNNETNLAEYYTGTEWKSIDSPPTITAFTIDGGADVTSGFIDASAGGNATIEIKGSLFDATNATVTFAGTSETISTQSITRNSANLLTVTVARSDFDNTNEPYAIRVTNGSGLSAELAAAISQDAAPTFSTAADTTVLSTYEGQSAPFSETTLAATDADGDTITHTISAGSLPPGLSLSTAGALEGTVSGSSIQDYTFTVQAATTLQTVTRQFVIAIGAVPFISATGGTVTTSGDYKIHTFTGDGCFVVSSAGTPAGSDTVSYMVVAGGASGGMGGSFGGGGGAGGFREGKASTDCYSASPLVAPAGLPVTATTYPITVGSGGAPQPAGPTKLIGNNGNNSVFSTITSTGGGGGGRYNCSGGNSGGSGGGSARSSGGGGPGSGNTPPVSPPQGSNGGSQTNGYGSSASGGGGATAAGASATPGGPASGGAGANTSISGSPITYDGGGGGGATVPVTNTGGAGGGGNGGFDSPNQPGAAGTANRGGGGGGNGPQATSSGGGGSGIVIVRYKFQ